MSCFLVFLLLNTYFVLTLDLFSCSKRSSSLSSSGAPVPATPLLSQSGGDVFAAIVPPVRSSFGFTKKKAE